MVQFIKWILMAVINLLPDSPFGELLGGLSAEQDHIRDLNWFLPLDIIANMTLAWLSCMAAYYIFLLVKKIIIDFVLNKILAMVSWLDFLGFKVGV